MKSRLTHFLRQASLSFGLIVCLLCVTIEIIFHAQMTLQEMQVNENASEGMDTYSSQMEQFRNVISIVLVTLAAMGVMLVFLAYRRWSSEGARQESESHLRDILQNSPMPIYRKDTSARFPVANAQ